MINRFNDDVIHNILARLPALSFAAAACVSKTWNRICGQILCRPKLASALSLNPSLINAVSEVFDKVLSEPIRPHFAIAFISEQFGLKLAHLLITGKLGSRVPLVIHISHGVMGKDALTDQLREVKWEYFDYRGNHPRESNVYSNRNQGIVLVLGFVPGLKVDAIPLFHPHHQDPDVDKIDKFVRDIKAYTAAASGCESPSAVMMFGDRKSDMNSVVAKMDYAMPKETVIVGDAGGCFLFNSLNYTINSADSYILDAVALVFAKDKDKSPDVGETEFHVIMGGGLMPFGPRFEVIIVEVNPSQQCSILSARMEGCYVVLDFDAVAHTVFETVSDPYPELYIAATQRRGSAESLVFYRLTAGESIHLMVDGVGIKPGDSFIFYHRDMETARTTLAIAYDNLKMLKERTRSGHNNKHFESGVFGGLIFSCRFRGKSYFGEANVDMIPFTHNFPGVAIAGSFCKGEIGRGSSSIITEMEGQEQSPAHCSLHASSAVYLALSYIPASPVEE